MLAGRPRVIVFLGLDFSAVVITLRVLGGRPVVTTVCVRWPMITVLQT